MSQMRRLQVEKRQPICHHRTVYSTVHDSASDRPKLSIHLIAEISLDRTTQMSLHRIALMSPDQVMMNFLRKKCFLTKRYLKKRVVRIMKFLLMMVKYLTMKARKMKIRKKYRLGVQHISRILFKAGSEEKVF